MPAFIDRTGQVFGRLTVLAEARPGRNRQWMCQCVCGTIVTVEGGNLQQGTTRSCGCLHRELLVQQLTKHGGAANGKPSPTYQTWKSMQKRCNNPNNPKWRDYGGRGIRICERWNEFANFLADMGEKPAGTSIERVDNDAGYEPGNCIWADIATQSWNKRNTRYVTVCGRKMPIREACDIYGVPHASIWTWRSQKRLTLTEAFFDRLERRFTSATC